jgi:hypothetical protein
VVQIVEPEISEIDESVVLNKLISMCAGFTIDYWSYEWCHRAEIKQFHIQPHKSKKGKRNPEWSLGVYRETSFLRDDMGNLIEVIDFFDGGQHCDETGLSRSTEVRFKCCSSEQHNPSDENKVHHSDSSKVLND